MYFILLHHRQQLEAAVEQSTVGHLGRAGAAHVLVHDLLEALQAVDRQEVAMNRKMNLARPAR